MINSVTMSPQEGDPGAGQTAEYWVRELMLRALNVEGPGTLTDVAAVIGAATGSRGVILWESSEPGAATGEDEPSALAIWLLRGVPESTDRSVAADQLTRQAYRGRTLALPLQRANRGRPVFGLHVDAAMPINFADGSTGALTLLGNGGLSDSAFDTAAELLTILPKVLAVLSERWTLALVNRCNHVLHKADLESPAEPLSRERLQDHFAEVCREIAAALCCTEVSILLRAPGGIDDEYGSFASSDSALLEKSGPAGGDLHNVPMLGGRGLVLEVPLASGNYVWGRLSCRGAYDPPFHFTVSDRSLLVPVAAQVATYLANWFHRRTISLENASWRRLAAGITGFNNLLAEELRNGGQRNHGREMIGAAALQLVRDVVPDATGGVVHVASEGGTADSELAEVAAVELKRAAQDVLPQAALAYATGRQQARTEPNGRTGGWIVSTPIKAGDKIYGTLTATGSGSSLPPYSVQVCEIMGDQLGLYRHLEHTMSRLHEARHNLKASLRGQAEAMEDLKHQLVSPLRTATDRTDLVLRIGRLDTRAQAQLRAVRGLCRKATRVAMSAGVFAALSKDQLPSPRNELVGVDDLLRMLIATADDAQILSNPRMGTTFDVDRDSMRQLQRQLVHADMSFLQQCVGNLLDNAAKYSYPGTQVRIAGAVAKRELALEVTSTGMPLDATDAARCLERNWRGPEARSWTGEGSGIGLWIVDNLMRSMKGRIEVEPVAETTTVRLIMPVA
jgi:signal transduction histidine kinase